MRNFIAIATLCLFFPSDSMASEKELDFQDFMINAKTFSQQVAIQAIRQGRVNSFIGNPGILNNLQLTPLTALISSNADIKMIEEALIAGANTNKCGVWKEDNQTTVWYYPLELALQHGRIDVAKLLLSHGANPNLILLELTLIDVLDLSKPAPVLDCVKLLIKLGANPQKKVIFKNGETWKYSALEEFQNYFDWQKSSEYDALLEVLQQPYVHPMSRFSKEMFYSNA